MTHVESIGLLIVVGLFWLAFKLIFGEVSGAVSGRHSEQPGTRAGGGPTKETAAAQAWRDARSNREKELRQRKQELLEAARRKYLEQIESGTNTAVRVGQSSSSSGTSSAIRG